MHRWQAGWPATSLALISMLAGCGGGDGGRAGADGGADVRQLSDSGEVPPRHDAGGSIEVSPPDVIPVDGRPVDVASADAPASPCLVLASEVTAAGEAPAPLPLPPAPVPPVPSGTGDPGKLPPAEVVARLARLIWRADPDPRLLARVEGCMRLTVTDVLALAQVMLRDPRAARGVQAFVHWWLDLDRLANERRDPAAFPAFTEELRRSMLEEVRLFVANVMFEDDGTFTRLMTAPYSFVDRHLAGVYGVSPGDDSFRRIDFRPADERAGLLTMPAVLAVSGGLERHSPPVRGKRLLERVLCFEVPPPPALAMPPIPPPSERPGQSLRQAMEKTFQDPACLACHTILEVGFAFEPFDAIGRHRTTDNGAAIDAHAQLRGQGDIEGLSVGGPVSLAETLARVRSADRCFAARWLEFAIGRSPTDSERNAQQALFEAFEAANLDIRTLIAHVAISAPFLAP